MSQFMKDSGHWWMQTCDECGGTFGCEVPEDAEAEVDWMCETCTIKDAQIKALQSRIEALENGALHIGKVLREADAEIARLREALKPFANFAERFDAKPMRGIADSFYEIHSGTEWWAELRLSDCRRALAALGEKP